MGMTRASAPEVTVPLTRTPLPVSPDALSQPHMQPRED